VPCTTTLPILCGLASPEAILEAAENMPHTIGESFTRIWSVRAGSALTRRERGGQINRSRVAVEKEPEHQGYPKITKKRRHVAPKSSTAKRTFR